MNRNSFGYTLVEVIVSMTIMAIACVAFASLLKYVMMSVTSVTKTGMAQESGREALMKVEEYLIHVNQIQIASATFVQFVVDIDQSPNYDPNAFGAGGIPNYRNADRDGDANLLLSATAQWQAGYNLRDDDEDGDGKIDVRERMYYSGNVLWFDMSINEAAWGGNFLKRLATNVSTVTFTYWGNKANPLGRAIDANGDGVIDQREMDIAGNGNGVLDTAQELQYITSIRVDLGIDQNRDGTTDHLVETDVYPPLLPLKSQSP